MLDIDFIKQNKNLVSRGAKAKGYRIDIEELLEIDKKRQVLRKTLQELQEDRNKAAKERNIEKGKEIKGKILSIEEELLPLEDKQKAILYGIPNPPKEDVFDEDRVIKTVGDPPSFDFRPRDHLELGEMLDVVDVKRAAKVSGARFGYLKNEAALLEFALVNLAMEMLIKEGFIPIVTPVLIKTEVMRGLGYMEGEGEEDMFHIPKDGLTLIGTAEHSIVPMHMDETLNVKDLPRRYVGFSSAFRREAGSYGKDTRGILRVHQFDKVEMVSFVKEGEDDKEHEYLLSIEEKLFQALKIPYQVVSIGARDLGFPAARKYDIEVWMPGQNAYREVTSVSTVTDFQSKRLNIKYQEGEEKKFVNILNGTGFAIGRTVIAILENYQQKDGSVLIPEVLSRYVGKNKIIPIVS